MMLPGKLGTMMKKAQEMQENMQKMQAELANRHIVGIAGAGAVKVTLNGHYACQRVELTEEALKEDKDMLEALLAAAISDASAKVNAMTKKKWRTSPAAWACPAASNCPSDELLALIRPTGAGAHLPARRRQQNRATHGVAPLA